MKILSPVPAQLGQITSVMKFNMNYQPLLCCALLFGSLHIEALHEGISSFVLLLCFPVASFLFFVFNLASKSWFCLFLDTFRLFSLGILYVRGELNQEAEDVT